MKWSLILVRGGREGGCKRFCATQPFPLTALIACLLCFTHVVCIPVHVYVQHVQDKTFSKGNNYNAWGKVLIENSHSTPPPCCGSTRVSH